MTPEIKKAMIDEVVRQRSIVIENHDRSRDTHTRKLLRADYNRLNRILKRLGHEE